jgi:predicted N-acetyltransferase YhbS
MDGNTWRSYRLVSDAGSEPPFFLEPWTPLEWNAHFAAAGFAPLATYHSSLSADLARVDERVPEAAERLRSGGVRLRELDPARFAEELSRIHELSLQAFSRNDLFTPVSRDEFVAQYRAVERYVDPRLTLVGERDGELAGFAFALPDLLQAQRGGRPDTVIVKTVAVRAGRRYGGLGAWLTAEVHARAAAAGFKRAVHALMHDANNSANISRRYATTLRRYTLYARRLR